MPISHHSVAFFHYVLTDEAGKVLDQSSEGQPLAYLQGANNIIPGLEKELLGKEVGDKLKVEVAPEEAYGEYHDEAVQVVPLSVFPEDATVEPGVQFQAQGPEGDAMMITVTAVEDGMATIDGNHPLAGKTLFFDVEIIKVRVASEDEIKAGRVLQA